MQYGMPTLVENSVLEENLSLCRKLGLSFIELNMNFPEYGIDTLDNTEALISAGEQNGIYYTIHLDETFNPADFNPLVRKAYLETAERTIEAAKKLVPLKDRFGNPSQPVTINMHMHHGIHVTLPDRKVQMYDRNFDVYMDCFRSFIAFCEERIGDSDVAITVENTEGFKAFEQQAVDLMLKSPVFLLTWDIGHSKAEGEGDVPFILARKDRLKHFHIHDGRENPHANHLALGDGEIDIAARLSLAEDLGARCVLETKTVAALEHSVEWLKQHNFK